MAYVKVNGIIIAENNFGDYDKMITMLTPNYGKISCVAKRARRTKSALLAGTQLFCFGEYVMYKGKGKYHINSCEIIEIFYNLRTDLDKLKYAIHINQIIKDVCVENENSFRILQLYLNTLYMISETKENLDFILSVFKLRLLCLLGFEPQINGCSLCGKDKNIMYFSLRYDGFICKECVSDYGSAIEMSENTKNAIKYIVSAHPKKIFSFKLIDEDLEELKLISKIYFNEKMEKEYKLEEIF